MTTASQLAVLDDRIAERYPLDFQLPDGTTLTVTPLVPSDWQLLVQFLGEVPQEDRLFLREDVSAVVEQWCSELDYQHNLPLLAWDKARIVADATLHQDPGLWTSHIGKMRLFVHPDYRQRGLGTAVAAHLVEVARDLALHKLVCECAVEQTELIELLKKLGFREAARLPEFIRDREARLHDMALMEHRL
jgi:RimJ/RimL family protein N-acetyltransferase